MWRVEIEANVVEFDTCPYQEGKVRSKNPGSGADALSKVCRCPAWVKHQAQITLAKADPAERYPKTLCDKVAKLVVATWKRSLNLRSTQRARQSRTCRRVG